MLQGLFWLRDLGHGRFGEKAPAFQLPFLLLLQQLAAHQPHDLNVVGEDADHVGAAFGHCAAKRSHEPLGVKCLGDAAVATWLVEAAAPVSIAVAESLLGALMAVCTQSSNDLQLDQPLELA